MNKRSLCTLRNLFLHSNVLRVKFKLPFALTVKQKKKRSLASKVFRQFKWNNLEEQDVTGQGSFGAFFVTRYTKDEDCRYSSSLESVVKTKREQKQKQKQKQFFGVLTSSLRLLSNMLVMCYLQK